MKEIFIAQIFSAVYNNVKTGGSVTSIECIATTTKLSNRYVSIKSVDVTLYSSGGFLESKLCIMLTERNNSSTLNYEVHGDPIKDLKSVLDKVEKLVK